MASKVIKTVDGYSFRFDQRAKGQETPYWSGVILRDDNAIGTFKNDGNGGVTIVTPWTLQKELGDVVQKEAKRQGHNKPIAEAYENMFTFAEMVGYQRALSNYPVEELWQIYIEQTISNES